MNGDEGAWGDLRSISPGLMTPSNPERMLRRGGRREDAMDLMITAGFSEEPTVSWKSAEELRPTTFRSSNATPSSRCLTFASSCLDTVHQYPCSSQRESNNHLEMRVLKARLKSKLSC